MSTQSQKTKPVTIVKSGMIRPPWICSNRKQFVILIRDKSGSMRGQKAKDASDASLDLVSELSLPSNKDGFYVAVVDFSSESKVIHQPEKVTLLNGKVSPISVGIIGESTNITAGLEDAYKILGKFEIKNENFSFLRPVVIVFTDGCHNEGPLPHEIANKLKQKADLVTVAFGSDADETLMRELASTPQHFYRCSNGRELRMFLASVGATISTTMASGLNSTQALSMIKQ